MARKVWVACARISDIGARALAEARKRLGPRDRRRYAAFGTQKRRRQFLAGRWLLQESARAWRPASKMLKFDSCSHRGVEVSGGAGASVSHAGDWVACVLVQRGTPGIDIEPMVERDFAALDKWVAHDERDAAQLVDAADARKAFYRRWTRYEARLKALSGAEMRASHLEMTYYFEDGVAMSVCLPASAAAQAPRAPRLWRRHPGFSSAGNLR